MKKLLILLYFFTICSFSIVNAAVCDTLSYDFNHSLKMIALSKANEIGDNSAPRQTNRLLEINTEYLKMSMYISIMKENSCSIKDIKWDWKRYYNKALEYRNAEVSGDWSCAPDCFIENWDEY